MQLRPYQKEAVEAFIQWFCDGKDRPLIVLPTGTGKSVVAAEICRDIQHHTPHARVLVATHVKELVRQNYQKLQALYPEAYAGIISAGLNRKDFHRDIMFGGIQTLHRNAVKVGHVDLMLTDEAHAIPRTGMGMWNSFIRDLKSINPNFRSGGMTATPFRLTTGMLVGGDKPQFDGICYEYSIRQAMFDGYLAEIVSAPIKTTLATNGVKKRGGEFIAGDLEKAINVDSLTKDCCDEMIELGSNRKSWLIFASGNAHAHSIHTYLQSKGLSGYVVTQETGKKERDLATQNLINGTCRYIVNNMILTTGFDCPRLDLIACMRPTQSAGLWVQMCGRGTRLYPGKDNCLLLDFGRNLDRHGPIDEISGSTWYEKKEKGEAPMRVCSQCMELLHAAARVCCNCGYEFPIGELKLTRTASNASVLSFQKQEPIEASVVDMIVTKHRSRNGSYDTMRVKYITLVGEASEFICYDHPEQSYPYQQAIKWGGNCMSVDDALTKKWRMPKKIKIKKDGKYFKVIDRIFD